MRKIFITGFFFCFIFSVLAQNKEVPFTQEDRDRIIRLEVKVEALDKRLDDMNNRFDDMNNRIDELREDLRMVLYTVFGGMFVLVGFILWDRRTTVMPLAKKYQALEKALTELAENNPEIREALKRAAIL